MSADVGNTKSAPDPANAVQTPPEDVTDPAVEAEPQSIWTPVEVKDERE